MRKLLLSMMLAGSFFVSEVQASSISSDFARSPLNDTVSKPTIHAKAVVVCDELPCVEKNMSKVNTFEPSTYFIMYKLKGTTYFLEKNAEKFKEILKTYKTTKITIWEGDITILGTKYPSIQYLVVLE